MNVIWLVNIKTDIGLEAYYAGAESQTDALLMAAKHGYAGDAVNVKQIPNKFGIQPYEWRSAI